MCTPRFRKEGLHCKIYLQFSLLRMRSNYRYDPFCKSPLYATRRLCFYLAESTHSERKLFSFIREPSKSSVTVVTEGIHPSSPIIESAILHVDVTGHFPTHCSESSPIVGCLMAAYMLSLICKGFITD